MIRTTYALAIAAGMLLIGLFGGMNMEIRRHGGDNTVATAATNNNIERVVRTADESSPRTERRKIETSSVYYVDGEELGKDFVVVSAKGIGAIVGAAQMLASATPTSADIASLCDEACRVRVQLATAKAERDPLYRNARTKRNTFSRTAKGYHNYRDAAQKFMAAQAKVMGLEKELRSLTRHPRTVRPATMVAERPAARLMRLRIADVHHDEPAAPSIAAEANHQLSALRNLVGSPDAKPAPVEEPRMSEAQHRALNLGICAMRAQIIWEKSEVRYDNEASGAPGGHITRTVVMHGVVDQTYYCDIESGALNLGIGYPLYHAKDLGVLYECRVTPTRSCGDRRDWKGFPFYSSDASAPEFRRDYDDGQDIRAPRLVRSE